MDNNDNTQQQPATEPGNDARPLLNNIRDRAFSNLVPLIDELDDSPEHKFDICLAAVRSTDNVGLLEKALSFAEKIEDKSERAQALIDVANEASVRLES